MRWKLPKSQRPEGATEAVWTSRTYREMWDWVTSVSLGLKDLGLGDGDAVRSIPARVWGAREWRITVLITIWGLILLPELWIHLLFAVDGRDPTDFHIVGARRARRR